MKQYLKKTKERLYRGNGEFLAFSVVAVLICTITIYFIAIIQMSSCMDDLSKAVTAASRVAAIDENLNDAKKDALDIAKYQLKRNSAIKKVSVDITYPVKNEWTSGNYILVTVKAKIKTIAPIKTKIHKKQILVTIEGISGQSIVIPANVPQTGILGGSDATNYTSWAPRLGYDCRPVAQLWLQNPTYMDNIATIGGLYCVAVKPTFGKVGDRIRVCLEDGQYFDCIIADMKGADATSPYGHVKGGGVSVVEFYSKGDPSNSASLASPIGKSSWLGKKVKKIINMGRSPGL